MTLHRGRWMALALMLAAGGGIVPAVAQRAQTAPTKARIIEIQETLAREGFYSGKPSGRWDAATTKAMKDFQTSKGLTATGKLGALSLQKLGLGSEIAGKAAPLPLANAPPPAMSESELDEAAESEEPEGEPENESDAVTAVEAAAEIDEQGP